MERGGGGRSEKGWRRRGQEGRGRRGNVKMSLFHQGYINRLVVGGGACRVKEIQELINILYSIAGFPLLDTRARHLPPLQGGKRCENESSITI